MKHTSFYDGFKLGITLQIGTVGPVCLLLFHYATVLSLPAALLSVWGATLASAIYMTISIISIAKVVKKCDTKNDLFRIASGIIIMLLGVSFCLMAATHTDEMMNQDVWHYKNAFLTVFLVNILNPLAIVNYTALFTSKTLEANYTIHQTILYAIGILAASPLFLSFIVFLGHFGASFFPPLLLSILNIIVGLILVHWGLHSIFPNTSAKIKSKLASCFSHK